MPIQSLTKSKANNSNKINQMTKIQKAYKRIRLKIRHKVIIIFLLLYIISKMALQGQKNQRQLLRQQFQLVAPNIKNILSKKADMINYYERQLLLNVVKKVLFVKECFDMGSPKMPKMAMHLELEFHQEDQTVFKKGDKGESFYIVLEGAYCVQLLNQKQRKKSKQIFYYPGDSFGEVSLIYDVPRGATIVADQSSCLIKVPKDIFNECGNLQASIRYLNSYFQNHPYFQNQDKFMIRIVSSLSKLVKFKDDEVIVNEGTLFSQILFFIKGQAVVYKTLRLENKGVYFDQRIQIDQLNEGDVFGQKFYLSKQIANIKIISKNRGQFIKVSFKDNVNTIDTPLYKRIRQNAVRYPTDQQILDQYKVYLVQKLKQLEYLNDIYKMNKNKNLELIAVRNKYNKVKNAKLAQ